MSPRKRLRRIVIGAAAIACSLGAFAGPALADSRKQSDEADTVRLGFFPNVTHAPAIVGVEEGTFEDALGDVDLETFSFNAGPEASEALLSGAIDATYIGPNPAINAFVQSEGAIKIISGATSGGAFLVVKPEIKKPKALKGKKIASPQLGNTQDVALRVWLKTKGFETDEAGGGDVSIVPQENSVTLQSFTSGDIDGAWVPEPWATRLIDEAGGKVLVDERDLWPDGEYVTTHLIVRTDFLEDNPGIIRRLLEGQVAANEFIAANREDAEADVVSGIEEITSKPIAPELVAASFDNLKFTYDPIASSLRTSAENAESAGLLDSVDLDGIYALEPLNKILKADGKTPVTVR